MPKRWRIHPHDSARIAALERAAGVPPVVAQLLAARGILDPAAVREFLDPRLSGLHDPGLLPGASAAAERIVAALGRGERIVVYGDYDVDGMSGAALLLACLKLLGGSASSYIPHRLEEGYGLHADALRALAERGAQLVITVDCGIASVAEAQLARTLGLSLIITDHHQSGPELPPAEVLVHPRLDGGYPFGELCGAGVAFKLAWVVCQLAGQSVRVSERMKSFLMQALGLAALGTIADVVPLVGENRILVRHGLVSLRQRPLPGVAALLQASGLADKPQLSSEDVAFTLAPRLNAAGRLGQAALGVELLTTDSAERALALAEYLGELNSSRDSLERSVYLAANKQAQEQFDPQADSALVLAGRGWHAGVIGIVASRLAEKFHRPVVLLALDATGGRPAVGSGRSVPGFDLHSALTACGEVLLSHGGHAAAAGVKLEESQIERFRQAFCEYAAGEIQAAAREAELRIDAEAPFSALTLPVVEQLERLAPFGQANPRPVLCASQVRLTEAPRRIGSGERHLSLRLAQHGVALRGVAFGGGDWCEDLARAGPEIAVAYRPVVNEFRGRRTVELQLCDWRPAEAAASTARSAG
jgi:single-stranded-DNA-specific exonuclease